MGSLPPLTDVQRRIVWGIAQGDTQDELQEALGIHRDTVRDHERKLKRRLGCADRVHLPAAVMAAYGAIYDGPLTAARRTSIRAELRRSRARQGRPA